MLPIHPTTHFQPGAPDLGPSAAAGRGSGANQRSPQTPNYTSPLLSLNNPPPSASLPIRGDKGLKAGFGGRERWPRGGVVVLLKWIWCAFIPEDSHAAENPGPLRTHPAADNYKSSCPGEDPDPESTTSPEVDLLPGAQARVGPASNPGLP